jgi:hypothetical protein
MELEVREFFPGAAGVFVRHHRYQKKKHGAHVAFYQTEVGIKQLKRQALHFTPVKLRP